MAGYGRNYYGDRGNYGGGRQENRVYQNSGSMFMRNKKSPNAPDMGGDFTIGGDVLTYIIAQADRGNDNIKLEISGWRRQSRDGMNFTSLSIRTPYSEREGQNNQYGQPQYRGNRGGQGGGYGRGREPDERQMMRGGYAEQSGRGDQRIDNRRQQRQDSMTDEEFARGDSLPDFMRDDEDGKPPF